MARYGISPEGVAALQQLASDLTNVSGNIEMSGRLLTSQIGGLSGLGVFGSEILELVHDVNAVQERGREALLELAGKSRDLASRVSELISSGI